MKAKRTVYIAAFTVLGILLQFVAHAVFERWYIIKLVKRFDEYSLGLTWNEWFLVHHVLAVALLIAGAVLGFLLGKFFYPKLYDEQGNKRWKS